MKLYNSLTKKVEELKPQKPNEVKMYSCGPTVYNYAHLGNLRTYTNIDVLRRWLEYSDYKVTQVINITDVEDKIIREANKEGVSIDKITDKFTKEFFKDLREMNIEKAEHYPKATEEIPVMIKMVEGLLEKGYAYKAEDGSIYFSIEKFKDYGRLSGVVMDRSKKRSRIESDEYEKEDVEDFVLWKAAKKGEPVWDAPFGPGRPGWHIECSAMSMKYLGETLDIHGGGIDLLFPHHENEIAQSEAYTGKTFAEVWFHGEFLLVEGRKMSKSLHNIYTINDLSGKFNVEPLAYRLLCLQAHYRDKLNFTKESILAAQNTLNNLRNFVLRLLEIRGGENNIPIDVFITKASKGFCEAMDDDLNSSKALAVIFDFIKEVNKFIEQGMSEKSVSQAYNFILEIDKVLGLRLDEIRPVQLPKEVERLVKERDAARANKEWDKSDKLRDKMMELGYSVEDTAEGTKVRKTTHEL